jgi:iron(III) transport system ATP-binding protein
MKKTVTAVKLERISKNFGEVQALVDVDLEIEAGEFFFFLGPSGCGKSTLLRIVAGLETPDHGKVFFGEREVTSVAPHRRNAGLVFQNYALWPHLTVAENVAYGLEARRIPAAERDTRVREALETVRLGALAGRRPGQLSGGQQQRVALARTLVVRPDVILLDEPLSNLDAALRLEMRREIRRIHEKTGLTMIYVTHDQTEALSMAHRLAILVDGRRVQTGTPREVYYEPGSRFVAEFIGEINLVPATVEKDETEGLSLRIAEELVRSPGDRKVQPGQSVMVGVRPEAVSLASPPDGSENEHNHVKGKVTGTTFLGNREEIRIALPSGPELKLVSLNPRSLRAEEGETVDVWFRVEETLIFAGEKADATGNRSEETLPRGSPSPQPSPPRGEGIRRGVRNRS